MTHVSAQTIKDMMSDAVVKLHVEGSKSAVPTVQVKKQAPSAPKFSPAKPKSMGFPF